MSPPAPAGFAWFKNGWRKRTAHLLKVPDGFPEVLMLFSDVPDVYVCGVKCERTWVMPAHPDSPKVSGWCARCSAHAPRGWGNQ